MLKFFFTGMVTWMFGQVNSQQYDDVDDCFIDISPDSAISIEIDTLSNVTQALSASEEIQGLQLYAQLSIQLLQFQLQEAETVGDVASIISNFLEMAQNSQPMMMTQTDDFTGFIIDALSPITDVCINGTKLQTPSVLEQIFENLNLTQLFEQTIDATQNAFIKLLESNSTAQVWQSLGSVELSNFNQSLQAATGLVQSGLRFMQDIDPMLALEMFDNFTQNLPQNLTNRIFNVVDSVGQLGGFIENDNDGNV
eukprot:TRINITY_DN6667_c1_g1_i1.p1 TRINITY_DN6667_c1_g1~~TRINITY_DN6667_c1_g1_i1.p1  ORF type:complete len:278 (-),score=30.54 TRINITY_DN6667_c1_g1_i1:428-1186(-)